MLLHIFKLNIFDIIYIFDDHFNFPHYILGISKYIYIYIYIYIYMYIYIKTTTNI